MPSPPSSFANNAVGYTHHYDQLNRLKKLRQYTGIAGTGTWDRSYITLNDQENITYDGNGNILTYGRNGGDTTAQTIDSLTYNYNYMAGKLINNQLQYIHDAVSSSGYNLDIRNQTNTSNYQYDGIGNITKDIQSGITNIGWTVYNKPDTIYKAAGNITYNYNTANQRISKTYNGLITWYIRDAQGNVLSVYDNADSTINWREQHLYGSSRIGMWTPNINLADSNALDKWDTTGYRQFELDNHLGNVMTTINDVRNPYFRPSHIGPIPGPLQYFTANVLSYQDYYAFGMPMPDRQFTVDSAYRYGFNGKEQDNEVMGYGNSQDYGERFYDVRIGRFRSVDPMFMEYPWYSSYQFAGNTPLQATDVDGTEPQHYENKGRMVGARDRFARTPPAAAPKLAPTDAERLNAEMQALTANPIVGYLPNKYGLSSPVRRSEIAGIEQKHRDYLGDVTSSSPAASVGYLLGGEKGMLVGQVVGGVTMARYGNGAPEVFPAQSNTIEPSSMPLVEWHPVEPDIVVNIVLTMKRGWTPEQQAEARAKVASVNSLRPTVVETPQARLPNLRQGFIKEGGQLTLSQDLDHILDLQLGGTDAISNLQGLNSSVNRSFGPQIQNQIKNLKPGTKVNLVIKE